MQSLGADDFRFFAIRTYFFCVKIVPVRHPFGLGLRGIDALCELRDAAQESAGDARPLGGDGGLFAEVV